MFQFNYTNRSIRGIIHLMKVNLPASLMKRPVVQFTTPTKSYFILIPHTEITEGTMISNSIFQQ